MNLVIFDCDGTIVDSEASIVLSMECAFRSLRMVPPTRERTLSVIGLSLREAMLRLAPEAEHGTCEELAERYKRAFRELDGEASEIDTLFPGAKTVIENLAGRTDLLLGIATGKSRRGVARLFEKEMWHDHFATVQTADDHPSKPHPSMILKAMADTGAAPEGTVMVGDTSYDMQMARAAGVAAIGVAWGYHSEDELRDAGADAIVERYADLPAALDAFINASSKAA